ncbi:MAG: hypothetical protein L0177_12760, partial [Chloroflexi bacterium]|nr:hypothetical protein [Chloroflexota bacterium]
MYCAGGEIDYGLDAFRSNTSLLKLHGSLNWGMCPGCKTIVPWRLEEYFSNHQWRYDSEKNSPLRLVIGSHLTEGGHQHCDQSVNPEPVIVPPTWSKGEHHAALKNVWSRAAYELGEAENVFVSGYSLTETDSFFRYLFALGSVGMTRLKRFWVFDMDQSGVVEKRFRNLLGQGALERFWYPSPGRSFGNLPDSVTEELIHGRSVRT